MSGISVLIVETPGACSRLLSREDMAKNLTSTNQGVGPHGHGICRRPDPGLPIFRAVRGISVVWAVLSLRRRPGLTDSLVGLSGR